MVGFLPLGALKGFIFFLQCIVIGFFAFGGMEMRKLFLFRIGGRDLHLPKLVGSFIVFAAVLLFFQSAAIMFEGWENIKHVNYCLENAGAGERMEKCQSMAMDAFGFYVRADQGILSNKQFAIAMISPIAEMFFWIAVMVFGVMVYNAGRVVIPVEESVLEIKKKKKGKKK